MMTVDDDLDIRRQEAASWFTRLSRRRVSAGDIKAFSDWRRDPANARAYERVETVWAATDTLAQDPDITALTADVMGRVPPPIRARALVSRIWKPLGTCAVAAVVVALAGVWLMNRPVSYVTGIGERRVVRLADGSRLTLDTGTRVQARLQGRRRLMELVTGQALFEVAHDPSRPFVVTAGSARITALGTRFDVRRSDGGARVTLIEGRVSVERATGDDAWALAPGQQLVTSADRPMVKAVDVARETSWTTGRLVFDRTPIAAAVAEVNRYSETRIDLQASYIAGIEVSGVFDAGDTDGFVAALSDLYPVSAHRDADGTVSLVALPK